MTRWASRLGAALLGGLLATTAAAEVPIGAETVDRTRLRVCADPASLPMSDDQGRGFENRIAELLAAHLGRPLSYTWYPHSMGFVRNTLRARLCDLIVGAVATDEMVQNTNPYYRSTYVLVHRAGEGERFGDLERAKANGARIGIVANTPVGDLLARQGLLAQARPYRLMVDTRVEQPARQMLDDLAAGTIDLALVWGPIAGYWATREPVPLELVPLDSDPRTGLKLDFWISMGIRQGEPEWKHTINDAIRALQPQIDAILDAYGVPRLDRRGHPVGAWAARVAPASD